MKKLLVFGDSLSSGDNVPPIARWVNLMDATLGFKGEGLQVINQSVWGRTAAEGVEQISDALALDKFDYVILQLGANDAFRGANADKIHLHLGMIIEKIQASGAELLLVGLRLHDHELPGFKYSGGHFHDIYPTLAHKYKVVLAPLMLDGVDEHKEFKDADGMHPNAAAQPYILRNILYYLQQVMNKDLFKDIDVINAYAARALHWDNIFPDASGS